MSDRCCRERGCKRKQPFKVRLGVFSHRWFLVTHYTVSSSVLLVQQKHDIHDELVGALLAAGWTPPSEDTCSDF